MGFISERIERTWFQPKTRFNGYIIQGELGTGKSSYAIQTMAEAFALIHKKSTGMFPKPEEAFEWALGKMFYDLEKFISHIENVAERMEKNPKDRFQREIVVCLDDAGLHAGKWLYRTNAELAQRLDNLLDVIRTYLAALIITVPNVQELHKGLREFWGYHLVTIRDAREYAVAEILKPRWSPYWKKMIYAKIGEDRFSPLLPDWVYERHMREKVQNAKKRIELLSTVLGEEIEKYRARLCRSTTET